jgi:hypothetical protein
MHRNSSGVKLRFIGRIIVRLCSSSIFRIDCAILAASTYLKIKSNTGGKKMIGKGFKWIMLFLSGYYLYLNLKFLAATLVESHYFSGHFFIMAAICALLFYLLARDLLKSFKQRPSEQPRQMKATPKTTDSDRETTIIDWFIVFNRSLLDQYFKDDRRLITLNTGADRAALDTVLHCRRTGGDNDYEIKFYPFNSSLEEAFNQDNQEHLELLDHLILMIRNYNVSPITRRVLGETCKILPLKRRSD